MSYIADQRKNAVFEKKIMLCNNVVVLHTLVSVNGHSVGIITLKYAIPSVSIVI